MEERTFEESLSELEKVATSLEKGDLSLDEALKQFEIGMKLSKECTEKLDKAEKRINILVQGQDGNLKEEEFSASEA